MIGGFPFALSPTAFTAEARAFLNKTLQYCLQRIVKNQTFAMRKAITMKLSIYAMCYARGIGFDTAMRVGTFDGYPLYVCDFYPYRDDVPCIGLPQYLIIKDFGADYEVVPLSLEETMLILREKKKRKKKREKKKQDTSE